MANISPQVDIAFKKIFGVEENKDLLISLINSIISEKDKVADVTILNPYNLQDYKNSRSSILDIKAISNTGEKFNIGMQIRDEVGYENRALFYWSQLYSQGLKSGDRYTKLVKTIGIHILNFNYFSDLKKYHNKFHIVEEETHIPHFKNLELHTIELSKFCSNSETELEDILAKVTNSLDIWVAFLTKHDLLSVDNLPEPLNNNNLKKALSILEVMGFNNDEQRIYEDNLKWLLDEHNALEKARDESEAKGIKKGIEKGIKKGIEKGIKKGIEKGINEVAINMLKQNIDIKTIAAFTGLSLTNIRKLKS